MLDTKNKATENKCNLKKSLRPTPISRECKSNFRKRVSSGAVFNPEESQESDAALQQHSDEDEIHQNEQQKVLLYERDSSTIKTEASLHQSQEGCLTTESSQSHQGCADSQYYSTYKQIKPKNTFNEREDQFLKTISTDWLDRLSASLNGNQQAINMATLANHSDVVCSQELPLVTTHEFPSLQETQKAFYHDVEQLINDLLEEDPQGLIISQSQVEKLKGTNSNEIFARLNNQLIEKVREVETQKHKMYTHWKNLRQLESVKKKERQMKIQTGQVQKRKRRTAVGIVRKYKCPVEGCQKSYGSDGSLNQHILSKHPREFEDFRAQKFQSVIVSKNYPFDETPYGQTEQGATYEDADNISVSH
ncbi:hypothetical protein FGO68_gene15852 [Halteria grandinella]|uniref:C2H2-type domain-containing protein n=1 Tax=Halteria grandinella TaxID=5974 RepID=A0A8J8NV65_HALGN|nr:hypothetical protein FGO68_gene15852 [Halteria grandinella]